VAATATARRAFPPVGAQRLPQDLHLHGLASQQALQVTDAALQLAQSPRGHHLVIGLDGGLAALAHAPPPPEQQARRDAVQAATAETVIPGRIVSSTSRSFCSAV
jgi:hypothetical protein